MRPFYRKVYVDFAGTTYAVDIRIVPPRAASRIDKVMILSLEAGTQFRPDPESRIRVEVLRILEDYEDVTARLLWVNRLKIVERAREEALCHFAQLMRKRGPRGRHPSVRLPSRCR